MKRLQLTQKSHQEILKITTRSIKKGEIIVCPTDTVYGLCSDALNKKAVKRIFTIKKRPKGKPLPIFVKDIKMARKFAKIDKNQEKFLKNPKITLVLEIRNKKNFPKGIVSQDNKIGIRAPNYNFLNVLLKKLNLPLAETSANISGKPASTKIKEVLKQFKNQKHQPDLIIDAGNLKKAKPSKVIDLTGSKPRILRK